ncbi:MAG: TlpA disulfide reductase family protein [Bacteroidales bacterium]
MKNLFLVMVAALLAAGCGKSDSVKISGEYNGEAEKSLYLMMVDVDSPVLIDSIKIKNSGKFRVNFKADQVNFYNIGFDDSEFITLVLAPGDNVKLNFNGNKLQENYQVSGSPESEKVRLLDQKLYRTVGQLDSLRKKYESASKDPGFDTLGPILEKRYLDIAREQRMYNISFILDNLTSFASIKALYQKLDDESFVLYEEKDLQYLKLVSDSLNKYFPNSRQAKSLASNLDRELNAMYLNRISAMAQQMETTALDANLPDLNGKLVRLSSLRNKNFVLLSFWSAESNECIANNIQMKEYYRLYHREGFEIYQVNLDASEERWKSSVRFDELPWISVRDWEDGVSNTARLFNVTQLPSNYLIDPQGEIIGKNLFGKTLQIKLSQIFD